MNRPAVRALFAATLLYFAALYVYVPSLPGYIAERTSSLAAVGVVLSMYGLWMAVLRMPVGVITDATGRFKAYLLGGVLLAGIGAVVMVLGRSIGSLAVGRAVGVLASASRMTKLTSIWKMLSLPQPPMFSSQWVMASELLRTGALVTSV